MTTSHTVRFFVLILSLFISIPAMTMEIPSGVNVFPFYNSIVEPLPDNDAKISQPIGFGTVANGGNTLSLKVSTGHFDQPVDLYLGMHISEFDPLMLYLINSKLGLQSAAQGITPWKSNVSTVNEVLYGDIPLELLPQSRYSFYLLAVPAGASTISLSDNFYLWSSQFTTLDLISISERAVEQLGGGAEAATAILLALDKGNSLDSIIRSILTDTLTETGDLVSFRTVNNSQVNNFKKVSSSICDTYFGSLTHNTFNDIEVCKTELMVVYVEILKGLNNGNVSEDELKAFVTAMTILSANKGYSPVQIHTAISDMLLTGSITIDVGGNIWENCKTILCKNNGRIKVEPIDPLAELIDFLEHGETGDEKLPAYGLIEIIGDICTPLLYRSEQSNSNIFDFGTCSAGDIEDTPNFQYDFSKVSKIMIALKGMDRNVHYLYLTPEEIRTHEVNTSFYLGNVTIDSKISDITYNSEDLKYETKVRITLNDSGDEITSLQLDRSKWTSEDRSILWRKTSLELHSIPLISSVSSLIYRVEDKKEVCNHISRYKEQGFDYFGSGSIDTELLSIECTDNNYGLIDIIMW